MHILLIHQAFASIKEAGGTRHHELARYFAWRGHHTTVITCRVSYLSGRAQEITDSEEKGVSIRRVSMYQALHASFLHRLFSFFSFMLSSFFTALFIKNVDLVWGTTPPIFQSVTAWLIARLKGVPFLLEVRDLWPDFAIAVGILKSPILIRLSRWLEKFLYSQADLVIVNSPGYVKHVSALGAKHVELVPNGADLSMFVNKTQRKDYRSIWGLSEKFLVMYAGAHGMSNNLGYILQAASRLMEEDDIHFLLLGDGKEKNNLRSLAEKLNLTNITFIDPLPKQDMGEALSAADVCVAVLLPIYWYKTTYPNKVFDYMAAGKPILLCIDGVIREVVESAHCGVFCDPRAPEELVRAIRKLAFDRNLCTQMGLKGKAYLAEHFNRENLAIQFAILLEELVNKNA